MIDSGLAGRFKTNAIAGPSTRPHASRPWLTPYPRFGYLCGPMTSAIGLLLTLVAFAVLTFAIASADSAVAATRAVPSPTSTLVHTYDAPAASYDGSVRWLPGRVDAHEASDAVTGATAASATSRTEDPSCACSIYGFGVAAKSAAELPEGYRSFSAAKRALGSPGEGNVFDHVVEQSQIKRSGFAPEEIHNPFNMNPVSSGTNQLKANYYSTKQGFTGGRTVRDWLNGQSFADQYEFGMDSVNKIQNGLPLP